MPFVRHTSLWRGHSVAGVGQRASETWMTRSSGAVGCSFILLPGHRAGLIPLSPGL